MSDPDHDPLCSLLRAWDGMPVPDAHLAARVRRRIEAAPEPSWIVRNLSRASWLKLAVGSVGLGIAVGIITVEIDRWLRAYQLDPAEEYRELIQPIAVRHLAGHRS